MHKKTFSSLHFTVLGELKENGAESKRNVFNSQ